MTRNVDATLQAGDRVLVTRLDYLGDVVLSLPLVDAIRNAYPGVEVDYLARRPGSELLEGDDRIDRVFTLERGAGAGESMRLIGSLRRRRYRAVVDLYSNPRSAWLTWFTGAPIRVGGDRRGRRHLYTHPIAGDPSVRAATEHHMQYGAPLGIAVEPGKPTLVIGDGERELAWRVLSAAGVERDGSRPIVGVHPGGKWSVKRWPSVSFAALIGLLRDRLGAQVVVFTGPGEAAHTNALRTLLPPDAAAFLGVESIRTVAAVAASLDALVACDGGFMHVAVATGTPTVGIFGSAEADVWFPYESFGPFRPAYIPLDCRPCHRHECPLGHTNCLNGLSADHVFEELARVLDAGRVRGGERV